MPVYEEVLDIAHQNVQQLGDQLNDLNDLKQSLKDAREIPDQWDAKFQEVAATTREYTSAINALATSYLEGSNTIIGNSLADFSAANAKLNRQIQELTTYDFASHFKTLQQEIAAQVKTDLRKEVEGVSAATGELDMTNEAFRKEVTRFSEVDLEAHFSRHQKLLSDVFNAINSINALLSTNTQTLIELRSGQNDLQTAVSASETRLTKEVVDHGAATIAATGKLRGLLWANLMLLVVLVGLVCYLAFVG